VPDWIYIVSLAKFIVALFIEDPGSSDYVVPTANRQHDDGSGRGLTEAVTQFCRSEKGKL
jgi:hypothetical protein